MGKRAQRIPSWPGVIHSNKGRIHLRRPTCDTLTFRLRRRGGPYIPSCRPSGSYACSRESKCRWVPSEHALRLLKLEHCFYKCLDGCFGGLGCSRIIAQVWTVHDARVLIGEWLLGFGVDEQPFGLLPDFAVPHTLKFRGHGCGLRAERIVKCMSRVRVFRHFDITAYCP